MNWLKNFFVRKKKAETFDIGGPEPDLDSWSLSERQECIDRIVESGKGITEATELADSWYIMEVMATIGENPTQKMYVPRPVWDWNWAWGQMLDTL